jgi:hypothetical protein
LPSVNLNTSIIQISNVTVNGNNITGSEQTIILTFGISTYFQFNDGIISISFPQNSTFIYNTIAAYVIGSSLNTSISLSYLKYD